MLLALSPKAHIALVSLPLFYWCCCHCCVVNTNVGTRMIVCIGTHGPLHPFAVVRDLVFDRGLDCNANATLKLSRACFHNGCSCNAFASLAVVNTFVALALLAITSSSRRRNIPVLALSLGYPLLGDSSFGPSRHLWLGVTALGPCTTVWLWVATELLFLCHHHSSNCTCGSQVGWV